MAAVPAGARILLDSTTLISHLDGSDSTSPLASLVVDELVKSGRNPAVLSMVTVMEILVRPRRRSIADYRHALDFLTRFPNLNPEPIDLPVAQEAASVRATQRLKPPDALVVATGIVHQVSHLVTNDKRWKGIADIRIQIVYLEDHLPI